MDHIPRVVIALLLVAGCAGSLSASMTPTEGTVMASRSSKSLSPALHDALERFNEFLVSDDAERGARVEAADDATLRELVNAVTPLYDEINATLDALVDRKHPVGDDAALLEEQLNSLGQVGMEAQLELEARGR